MSRKAGWEFGSNHGSQYMQLPYCVLGHLAELGLAPLARIYCVALLSERRRPEDDVVFPGEGRIADRVGVGERHVGRDLKKIEATGLIKIIPGKRGSGHPNQYDLTVLLQRLEAFHAAEQKIEQPEDAAPTSEEPQQQEPQQQEPQQPATPAAKDDPPSGASSGSMAKVLSLLGPPPAVDVTHEQFLAQFKPKPSPDAVAVRWAIEGAIKRKYPEECYGDLRQRLHDVAMEFADAETLACLKDARGDLEAAAELLVAKAVTRSSQKAS